MQTSPIKNLLLLSLPENIREAILSQSELVHLDLRETLMEPGKAIRFIDFPEIGVMSLLQPMSDGSLVEIANIGNEGMVGVSLVMGVAITSELAFCQVEGTAWRIDGQAFMLLVDEHPELRSLCQRYAMTLFYQVARNIGCNRTHSIEERCARWLLLTHDRCHEKQFVLTQEFLSLMLGVSRSGVNLAAGILSKAQLITYVRGKVTILDRVGLEAASCECYSDFVSFSRRVMDVQ